MLYSKGILIANYLRRTAKTLDKQASPKMVSFVLKTVWDGSGKVKNKFIAVAKEVISSLIKDYTSEIVEKALSEATGGAVTLEMLKTSSFSNPIDAKASDLKGFVSNIEEDTLKNTNIRKVL